MSFSPPTGLGGPQHIPRPSGARLGSPAPWAELFERGGHPSWDEIHSIVSTVRTDVPPAVTVDGRPPSAVLAPVYIGDEGPTVVLTRRAWTLRSHTGELSFPGGRMEPDDVDLRMTALRESEEEIGLDPSEVTIVGELPRLTTVSSPALIVPYVGFCERRPDLVASPDEVDAILDVPLARLLDPAIYREEIWPRDGHDLEVTFFELPGDTLWGATARMLRSLFEALAARR